MEEKSDCRECEDLISDFWLLARGITDDFREKLSGDTDSTFENICRLQTIRGHKECM